MRTPDVRQPTTGMAPVVCIKKMLTAWQVRYAVQDVAKVILGFGFFALVCVLVSHYHSQSVLLHLRRVIAGVETQAEASQGPVLYRGTLPSQRLRHPNARTKLQQNP
jgi:hypothetical protein